MVIQNGLVFRKCGIFERADVRIRDERIVQIGEIGDLCDGETVLDAAGKYVVPGFVDIHLHGAAGHDFCDLKKDSLEQIALYERSCGVTGFCPASMTLPAEELQEIFRGLDEYARKESKPVGARVLGIYLEGPFLAEERSGAQKKEYLRAPDMEIFQMLQAASGNRIRIVTLAPELSGALDFIRAVGREALRVGEAPVCSIGHSGADFDTTMAAFDAGARHVTHLMNAMPPLHHRQPAVIGAAMDREDVMVEVICDGEHIHPAVIRILFRIFGPDRICLISDSTEATGMPDGTYQLGGQTVSKRDGAVRLSDGTLAGSAVNLFDCFRNAIAYGIRPEDALKAVTVNPAKSIGMDRLVGVVEEGAYADLILLNENWELEKRQLL